MVLFAVRLRSEIIIVKTMSYHCDKKHVVMNSTVCCQDPVELKRSCNSRGIGALALFSVSRAAAETATQTNLQAVHQNTLSNPICQTEMTAILKVFERDGHRI